MLAFKQKPFLEDGENGLSGRSVPQRVDQVKSGDLERVIQTNQSCIAKGPPKVFVIVWKCTVPVRQLTYYYLLLLPGTRLLGIKLKIRDKTRIKLLFFRSIVTIFITEVAITFCKMPLSIDPNCKKVDNVLAK